MRRVLSCICLAGVILGFFLEVGSWVDALWLNIGNQALIHAATASLSDRDSILQRAEQLWGWISLQNLSVLRRSARGRAQAEILREDYPAAIALLTELRGSLADDPLVDYYLGASYERLGRADEVVSHWQSAGASVHLRKLATQWANERRWEEAALGYRAALVLVPEDIDLRRRLGTAVWRAWQDPAAIAQLEAALEIAPDDVGLHLALGGIYLDLQQWEEAGIRYERAYLIDPASGLGLGKLGFMYIDRGQWHLAEQVLQQAVLLSPLSAEAHAGLGVVYYQHAWSGEAVAELELAVELLPGEAWMHQALADVYRDLGDYRSARQEYQLCLDLPGGNDDYVRDELDKLAGSP